MLIVLSPAKKLDFESDFISEPTGSALQEPRFMRETQELVGYARKLAPADLKAMMGISDALAELNAARFKAFTAPFSEANARPALDAFKGDVYVGLDAPSMPVKARLYAQERVRILSGLYGLLRPLDLMQAYRLEMGTKFKTPAGNTLYKYWGSKIAEQLNADAGSVGANTLINLASGEYFKAVDQKALALEVVTPVFKEVKDGTARIISFHAKKARGLMARYAADHEITSPEDLKAFDADGYNFAPSLSSAVEWVFTRHH